MKYFSMFSGVGGFELGIQQANSNRFLGDRQQPTEKIDLRQGQDSPSSTGELGYGRRKCAECVGYSEIDKYAIQTYERNFNGHKNWGDATKIDERELPDFDLLVGGFPCQAFSVAGKRNGFNDTRGTLFFDIARILSHKRPRHLVLENVKGLLSHDSGKTFTTILGVLTDLGYDIEWQVLNAKDFGVPQNRERVFIVGHLGGECGHQIFPIGGDNGQTLKNIGYLNSTTWQKRNESIRRVYSATGIAPTTPTGTGGGVMTKIAIDMTRRAEGLYRERKDGISGTVTATYYKGIGNAERPGVLVRPVLTPDRAEKRQNGRRFKNDGEPSFTLNTQDKHGIYDGARIRRLTPLECERLMSWPDNWTKYGLSSIMGICANISPVIEKLLPELATVQCTTSVGKDTEHQIYYSESNQSVSFAVDGLVLENSAIDTTKAGNDMVMHYNQNAMSPTEKASSESSTLEKTAGKSISRLWRIVLAEKLSKEKLSTTLTLINEIMTLPIFTSVAQEQNITGYIIHFKKSLPNYSNKAKLVLMEKNTILHSDTQRYKQCGNGVVSNCVQAVMERLLK